MLKNFCTVRSRLVLALLVWAFAMMPVAPVSALSDTYIHISYPPPGEVIESGSTIYFGPGSEHVHQWRVTIGSSPNKADIYDSGVRLFANEPWELAVDGALNTGKPVTLRFWQRSSATGAWAYTDTQYNTRAGNGSSSQIAQSTPSANANSTASAAPVAKSSASVVTSNNSSTVAALRAQHRNGQTFLTWTEVQGDVGYHVYRHTSPITASTIRHAEKLTGRWGPLDNDTSVNKHAYGSVPSTYVISDLGKPLSEAHGLFVNTPANNGAVYYAVTTVSGGRENIAIKPGQNSLSQAVVETVAEPMPVLTLSLNKGHGRLYTQYMDYANWNPTFNGYAYNYSLTLPVGYKKSKSYPLLLRPHAYGEELAVREVTEYNWQVIQIFPQDPGPRRGSIVNSWWFGYAADHNYLTDGEIPTTGSIANFTEARVLKAVKDTIADPEINVDPQLVSAFGHSMGASGALSFGIRYGNLFAGIYANEAMTNYTTSPLFKDEWVKLWGAEESNLPVVFQGPYTNSISRYQGTGVWDWMNHQKQMVSRRGDRMAYFMLAHGKADTTVDWATQGAPMTRVFNDAAVGYSARYIADAGHAWLGFTAANPLLGFGNDVDFPWHYPLSDSYPAIANASGSGPVSPGRTQDNDYNRNIEWSTSHTKFGKPIVDKPRKYEISLRSKTKTQTADVTPRNLKQFIVRAGEQCSWVAVDKNKRKKVGKGTVVADADGLMTIKKLIITPKRGTRLTIKCS